MPYTKEQVQAAVGAGLAMTDPKSQAPVPMCFAAGALILHQLLLQVGNGSLALVPVAPPKDPKAPNPPAKPPGTPNSKKKCCGNKRAVKNAIRAVKK